MRYIKHFQKGGNKERSQILWNQYEMFRNQVVNMTKVKKNLYYEHKIDVNRNNHRMRWKSLKTLIKVKGVSFPNQIVFHNTNVGRKLLLMSRK